MRSTVALAACDSYEDETVLSAMRKLLCLLGGAGAFAREGEKILLKPNLLAARTPERAVTTHPSVFEAAARLLAETGARLSYGDSPGTEGLRLVARKAGLSPRAERLGIPEGDFHTAVNLDFPAGRFEKSFPVAQAAAEADGIISLCKMKTHGLTRITGAVKNTFGCVAGFEKARFHLRFPNARRFAGMLTDLNLLLKPRLYIMDGVVAMEGEGPSSGDPVRMGLLLASRDPVALDAVFCRLVALDPGFVPTITEGAASGLGVFRDGEIEILGDPPERFRNPAFRVTRMPAAGDATLQALRPVRNLLIPRPVIHEEACRKCGICVKACPVTPKKALSFPGGNEKRTPVYDYSLCIRCYICHEMCPHRAIRIRTPLLGRVVSRLLRKAPEHMP